MFKTIEDLSRELQFISSEMDKQRFAGLDQNPHGIRDLLYSCAALAERLNVQKQREHSL